MNLTDYNAKQAPTAPIPKILNTRAKGLPAFTTGTSGWHTYAICTTCGEAHYVDNYGRMKVNGHVVHECVNCAYLERGVRLW